MHPTIEPQFSPERFRDLRQQRQLKPNQLAYLAGLTETQVYRLERGERPNLYAVTLARIALVLGTTSEYLLGLTDDPSPIATVETSP